MKIRYFTIIAIVLILTGCNPNNPTPNPPTPSNSVNVMWQGTIDGSTFNYTGSYIDLNSTSNIYSNPGRCDGNYANLSLVKGTIPGITNNDASVIMSFNTNVTLLGTHVLNSTNNGGFHVVVAKANGNGTEFTASSNYLNSNLILNITEWPSNVGGLIKGNLTGDIATCDGSNCPTKAVSVSFEAIRLF
jgi:hypothetical protein